jgi:hypothetical protein
MPLVTKIPPPERRLCHKHGKPLSVSAWRNGHRTSGCWKCINEHCLSPASIERRAKKWDEGFIVCAIHPNRRCNKTVYLYNSKRRCASCNTRRADYSYRPGHVRAKDWSNPLEKQRNVRRAVKKMLERNKRSTNWHGNRLTPLEIFAKLTGMTQEQLNFPRR